MKNIILLLTITLLFSCGKSSVQGNESISSNSLNVEVERMRLPQIQNSSSGRPWYDSYSKAIADEILKDENISILKRSISRDDLDKLGCPNFVNMNIEEKISFFIVYLSSIAEAESDFNNLSMSKAPDKTINIGLFQIDIESAKRHGGRDKYKGITENELKVGEINSRIAVNILRNQLRNRNNSLFPRYYWEVLYSKTGFSNFERHFNLHVDQLNCRSL